ncbi:hypothetical protein SprV_0200748100 [Sparganum proliferum]
MTLDCETSTDNSVKFLDKPLGLTIAADDIMVAFDVVSLFTPIQLDLVTQYTEERFQSYDMDVLVPTLFELFDLFPETN